MTLAQMRKKRFVSRGLPGPTTSSHQPGLFRRQVRPVWRACASQPATCASPVSAWQTSIAFVLSGDSSPYVSYSTVSSDSERPDSSEKGCSASVSVIWCASVMPTEPGLSGGS